MTARVERGASPGARSRGLIDAHMHMMAFEFLGGDVALRPPVDPYGVTVALADCPDHDAATAPARSSRTSLSYGNPVAPHDPVGWPTFKDWPDHSLADPRAELLPAGSSARGGAGSASS